MVPKDMAGQVKEQRLLKCQERYEMHPEFLDRVITGDENQ